MKKPKIIVVGSSNTDMIVKSARIPAPGETVIGGRFQNVAGGKGANQAVAAARLGADVLFIARVGKDMFGENALAGYKKEGINVDWVIQDDNAPTGVALILIDDRGENMISVASGANLNLSPADVARAEKFFAEADMVVSQLETPMETLIYTAELAAKYKVPMIVDPAPAPDKPLPKELLSKLFCIKPNENEASRLTGVSVTDTDSAQKAADKLLETGAKTVIVTLGTNGSLVAEKIGFGTLVPTRKVQAVDSTAAGDCYTGALACALAKGKTLLEAAAWASRAAAISVTRLGAQTSLPYVNELD